MPANQILARYVAEFIDESEPLEAIEVVSSSTLGAIFLWDKVEERVFFDGGAMTPVDPRGVEKTA